MRRPKKRRGWRILLWLVVILVGVRVGLPYWLRSEIEAAVTAEGRYQVAVGDVDLHLWRGAYEVHDIRVTRAGEAQPIFTAQSVALTLSWRGLAHGAALGEVRVEKPVLRMEAAQRDEKKAGGADWKERLAGLYPFRIGEVSVRNGSLRYGEAAGGLALTLEDVEAHAENLTNVERLSGRRPARLQAKARLRGGGLGLNLAFDPFAKQPTFSLEARVTDVTLADAGAFFRSRANLDVEGGTLDALIDVNAADGAFRGTVRPVLDNVRLVRWQEDRGGGAWEALRSRVEEAARQRLPQLPGHFSTRVVVSGRFPAGEGTLEGAALALGESVERALAEGFEALVRAGGS